MSCYNCCTRVNLTSQLLLTKGKHADSHWNKPEHRFALQFTTWEGWEWGLFQDVGPLSPSLPREFRFVAVVPNTRELTKWRWRCHLPLHCVFPTRKGRAKRDCCCQQGQRSLLPAVTTAKGCGLGASGPWQVPVLQQVGMQMTGLTQFLHCVSALTSYQIWEQSKNKYLEIIPILWFLIFNFINFFQVLNPDRFIYASGRLFDSHRSQYSLVLHHQTKNW